MGVLLSGSQTSQKCFDGGALPWDAGAGALGISCGPICDGMAMLVRPIPLGEGDAVPRSVGSCRQGWGDAPSTPCHPGGFGFPSPRSIAPALAAGLSPALLSAASEAGGVREAEDRRRAEGPLHRQPHQAGQVSRQRRSVFPKLNMPSFGDSPPAHLFNYCLESR